MQDREEPGQRARERAAWPEGRDVSHLLGIKLARILWISPTRDPPSTLGMATHYLLSIGPATLYAGLRGHDPRFAADRGIL
jgi:hypothetical protein